MAKLDKALGAQDGLPNGLREQRPLLLFLGWRVAALLPICVFAIARSLAGFAAMIQGYLRIHYDMRFELGMVIGQVVFQWLVLTLLYPRKWTQKLDYALILMAVSALGAVLLVPLLMVDYAITPVAPLIAIVYFFAVVGVMFAVHYVLVVKAYLPKGLCVTWVIYRLLILAFILKW